jgi:mannose-6-phosphate isomerase-like protein (cupin superfamily)
MDIKSYISSGILEDYCLGVLNDAETAQVDQLACMHPEIRTEIAAFQNALEQYAVAVAEYPSPRLKNNLFDILDNLAKEYSLSAENLPLLSKYSDHKNWLKLVKPMLPASLEEEMLIKILRNDEEALQSIVWLKNEYPDEVHDNLKECFIVLEGECECHIGSKVIKLGPGDFLDIPLYEHHDVKVIKGPVLAVVQRLKVA